MVMPFSIYSDTEIIIYVHVFGENVVMLPMHDVILPYSFLIRNENSDDVQVFVQLL